MLYWKLLKSKDRSEEKATHVHILVMHMRAYIHERSWKRSQVSHISKWQGVKVSVKSQWCTDELRRLFEMFDFDQLEWLGSDHLSIGLDLLPHPCNGIAPCTLGYVWCSFGGKQGWSGFPSAFPSAEAWNWHGWFSGSLLVGGCWGG